MNEKILQLTAVLFEYYGKADQKKRIMLYAKELSKFPFETVLKAIEIVKDECEYLPAYATIYKQIKAMIPHEEHNYIEEMWSEIKKKVAETGIYKPQPKWSNEGIAYVVKCIGWDKLVMMNDYNEETLRRRAENIYQGTAEKLKVLELAKGKVLEIGGGK